MELPRILVVEDEKIVALDLQKRLTRLGYAVPAPVATGEEALDLVTKAPPDLVLMDIRLNGQVDGVDAARQIKERFEVPVIYLTAYADETTVQRAKLTEPFGYLLKPFEDRGLQSSIEVALHKHRLEQKLKAQERWLAATLRSIGDGVITVDAKNRVTFMNPLAERLTGWKLPEAQGRDLAEVFEVITTETKANGVSSVIQTMRGNHVVNLSQHSLLVAKNGAITPIDRSKAPIIDDEGQTTGLVIVFRDVTAYRRLEESLRRAEARSRDLAVEGAELLKQAQAEAEDRALLLREVNHRVKNNLAAIIGLLYLERSRIPDAAEIDCQEILTSLISRIEGLATIHTMLSAEEWRSLPLDGLIRQIINTVFQVIPAGRQVSVEISPAPLLVAPKVAGSLAILINELTTNVIKHALSTDYPTEIKVMLTLVEAEVTLEFRDNGPGFPETALKSDGKTVGLSLIKRIVDHSLEGQVNLHNDQGAVITIRCKADRLDSSKSN
jgi:PAS domain S-box-containing protein